MLRSMLSTLFALALASAAHAATLTVVADQVHYNIGDTATLTVTADTQGASSLLAFGRLLFDTPVGNYASGRRTRPRCWLSARSPGSQGRSSAPRPAAR